MYICVSACVYIFLKNDKKYICMGVYEILALSCNVQNAEKQNELFRGKQYYKYFMRL